MAADPDKPAVVTLVVPVPPVEDGVALKARLAAAFVEAGAGTPAASFAADVWVLPADPFVDRGAWLRGLKITLYDPAKATGKALAALNVPFDEVANPAALADLTGGVLVVGEGVSFKEERGLAEALAKLAAGGVAVVCLAPTDGERVVPGLGGPAAGVAELTLGRDPARRLDERFAGDGWPADPKPPTGLTVTASDGAVAAEAGPHPGGWPWAEARFAGTGRWVVCGLPLLATWDDGPASRFLFLRLLETVTEAPTDKEKK